MGSIKFAKVRKDAKTPSRATEGAAGLDLCACVLESVTIEPGKTQMISTGMAVALPERNLVGLVFARSGLATKHGVALANSVGVIDSDYRGEIFVPLRNFGDEPYTVKNGDRVAQLVVMPVSAMSFEKVETLDETERGQGGFGSTGR